MAILANQPEADGVRLRAAEGRRLARKRWSKPASMESIAQYGSPR